MKLHTRICRAEMNHNDIPKPFRSSKRPQQLQIVTIDLIGNGSQRIDQLSIPVGIRNFLLQFFFCL